ncbi:hypothetical protein KR093_011398, partial [Drosophila rubida]
AWPIIIISLVGLSLEVMAILRLAVKRDDVWYTKGLAPCEIIETRRGYPPHILKFLVINQKYETPKGLIDAVADNVDGPPSKYCRSLR